MARRVWWTALAVGAALVVGVAGCGSGEQGTDVEKIAFAAPYGDNDPDWTLQAEGVVQDFPRQLGVRVDTADLSQTDDVRGALEQLSHEGNQLVIAHDGRYADVAEAVAKDSGVPELVWGEGSGASGAPVGHVTVQDKEGGYLAGLAAAKAAITRRLGVVVVDDGSPWDLATWNRTAGGFVAGARSIDPKVRVLYAQAGSDGGATVRQARAAARRVLADGAQMTLVLGGASALGAQRAVEARRGDGETLFISVVSDRSTTRTEEPSGVPYMLGSIMWDARPAFRRAVADVSAGTFGERPYALTLANRGVWLDPTGRMPSDAYDAAAAAQARIERGALDVPATPTSDAVEALIAGGAPTG